MKKIWKQIKDYQNYEVSNFGEVRNKHTHYIIAQSLDGSKHLKVMLYKNGRNYLEVHKLVFEAFYRKLLSNEVVHHLNFQKDCNLTTNLVAWDETYHRQFHRSLYKVTEQTKRKQSRALKGRKFTPQHIANITAAQRARRLRQKELALNK